MNAVAVFTEYSEDEHRYFVDGRELPSVTQILDASGLISPFCKDEEARFRGTQIHELTAKDDVTPLDLRKVPRAFRGYVRAWRKYRRDTGFMPTLIEHRIDSQELGYSGRFDRLGVRRGQHFEVLLDIKTTKSGAIPDYSRLQLSGYALAHDARKVFERITVTLMPDGRYSSKPWPIHTNLIDRAEWMRLVKNYKQEKNNGQRNN